MTFPHGGVFEAGLQTKGADLRNIIKNLKWGSKPHLERARCLAISNGPVFTIGFPFRGARNPVPPAVCVCVLWCAAFSFPVRISYTGVFCDLPLCLFVFCARHAVDVCGGLHHL